MKTNKMQQLSAIVPYKTKELLRDYVNPLSYDIDSRSSSGFKYNEGKLYFLSKFNFISQLWKLNTALSRVIASLP